MLKHHGDSLASRWGTFSLGQQLIMIANELNRAGHWFTRTDSTETKQCYERALELFYLTIRETRDRGLLRELCRAREMLCMLYIGVVSVAQNSMLRDGIIALSAESYTTLNPRT